MIFSTNIDGGTVTLNITGELDAVSVPDLRPVLDDLISKGHKKIVIDLTGLRLIDSSGVGAIVYLFRRVRASGGRWWCGGPPISRWPSCACSSWTRSCWTAPRPDRRRAGIGHVAAAPGPGMLAARLREKHFDSGCRGTCATSAGSWPSARFTRATATCCSPSATTSSRAGSSRRAELALRAGQALDRGLSADWRGSFRDADGRSPRHSVLLPGRGVRPRIPGGAGRAGPGAGLGEVELHLHHDNDTADNLRRDITDYLELFAEHGHLSRDGRASLRYAFIHGNWCLANARSDGRWCGVDDELPLLYETGCYADFTFPAAPDESQPGLVNQIYWPDGDLARRRAYDAGAAGPGGRDVPRPAADDRGAPGPGGAAAARRFVRIENARHHRRQTPATAERVRSWVQQNIHVDGRPEWVFVKVHTHGAQEHARRRPAGRRRPPPAPGAAARYNDGQRWSLHYVTAREMYNVAIAAMDGRSGDPGDYRDYLLKPPPVAAG